MITKTQVGKTFVIVTSEFSTSATQTLERKIEGLILRHIDAQKQLAIPEDQSQYGQQEKGVFKC